MVCETQTQEDARLPYQLARVRAALTWKRIRTALAMVNGSTINDPLIPIS
jgi:hypothetical protein